MRRRSVLGAGVAAVAASGCAMTSERASFDLIIRGGEVFDGGGGPPRTADIGVRGDRIAVIGDLRNHRSSVEIDAAGLAVAPGFINMLSWATESLIEDGRSLSDIKQGVTLEVMGEGWSMGPFTPEMRERQISEQTDIHYAIEWTTLGEYLQYLEQRGVSCNVASFVGATTVRIHEVGYDNQVATPDQTWRMQELVRAAMREGALGVGSSLIYAPGNFANTDELVALTRAARELGGGYISHIRSEADHYLEALDELVDIGRRSSARVQMYHMKPAGAHNWDKALQGIDRLNAARRDGIDVTANIYPYTAGATGLYAAMPLWVQEGGQDAWIARLRDPSIRARVLGEMRAPAQGWENLYHAAGGAENVLLIGFRSDALKPLTGRTLASVAQERAVSAEDAIIDLIVEDNSRVTAAYFLMSEDNIRRNILWPWTMVGSDEASLAPEGAFLRSNPHPRAYGTFARFLGQYVRDEGLLSLSEGIRRLTSLPAAQLGLRDRGALRSGGYADIAVFDPDAIADQATYDAPHQFATGMRHVVVNGAIVLRDGDHTGAKPGRFVRGPGYRQAS
jgi:N-acyl-D-amino-acid deacylase